MNTLPASGNSGQRASDADRERTAGVLNEALADGRLSLSEHDQRLEALYSSKTLGDLEGLTFDLPQTASRVETPLVLGFFSKIVRSGSGKVAPLTRVKARFGAVVLDLSAFEFPGEVTVEASTFCGKIILTLPKNARISDEGTAVLGKRRVFSGTGKADGPIVHITGKNVLGKVVVYRSEKP